jgi:hypothetical protein
MISVGMSKRMSQRQIVRDEFSGLELGGPRSKTMRIVHRISFASNPDLKRELAVVGIEVAEHGFVTWTSTKPATPGPRCGIG